MHHLPCSEHLIVPAGQLYSHSHKHVQKKTAVAPTIINMAPAGHRLKTKNGCKQCLSEKAVPAAAQVAYKHVRVRRYKEDTMEVDVNANNVIDVHGSKLKSIGHPSEEERIQG